MKIRRYVESDITRIIDLFYETVHSVNKKDYSQLQLDAWAPNEEKHLRQKAWNGSLSSNFTLVAEQDEFIVGFTDMTPQGHIERLFVHKNFQGQGVASALVVALETEARKLHLTEMSTEASITAKPFFKHMGFKVKESQNVERKGVLLTNFKMWKDL